MIKERNKQNQKKSIFKKPGNNLDAHKFTEIWIDLNSWNKIKSWIFYLFIEVVGIYALIYLCKFYDPIITYRANESHLNAMKIY